jgi:hypothetical protein
MHLVHRHSKQGKNWKIELLILVVTHLDFVDSSLSSTEEENEEDDGDDVTLVDVADDLC